MKKFTVSDIEFARKHHGFGAWQDAVGSFNHWCDQAADNGRIVEIKLDDYDWATSLIEYFDLRVIKLIGRKDGDYAVVRI